MERASPSFFAAACEIVAPPSDFMATYNAKLATIQADVERLTGIGGDRARAVAVQVEMYGGAEHAVRNPDAPWLGCAADLYSYAKAVETAAKGKRVAA